MIVKGHFSFFPPHRYRAFENPIVKMLNVRFETNGSADAVSRGHEIVRLRRSKAMTEAEEASRQAANLCSLQGRGISFVRRATLSLPAENGLCHGPCLEKAPPTAMPRMRPRDQTQPRRVLRSAVGWTMINRHIDRGIFFCD
jgi:hypothetical protein